MSLEESLALRMESSFGFVAVYEFFYSNKTEQHFFDDFSSFQSWLNVNPFIRKYSIFKISNNQPLWMASEERPTPQIAQEQSTILS